MIAFLRGKTMGFTTDTMVVNVGGVGYELFCSSNTLSDSQSKEDVSLHVYTHVREDAIHLFGFSTKTEKDLFLALNKVNGVGPKMAQKILSGTSLQNLIGMIESEDAAALSKLPKVGKKTAEQIILTLKGKLVLDRHDDTQIGNKKDITSALVHLGFKLNDVEKFVQKLPSEVTAEEGVRLALQALTNI